MESHRPGLELLLSAFPLVPATQQDHLEGGAESLVAQSVAHGVDGAVDVAEPVAHRPQGVWDAVFAEGADQHHDVVRRPCDDESQQDGAQRLGRFLLLHQRHALPLGDLSPGSGGEALGHRRVFQGH